MDGVDARFVHQAGFFESDDEFLEVVLPFIREGLEANEPTFIGVSLAHERLIRTELGNPPSLTYLVPTAERANPLAVLRANLKLFESQLALGGSGAVRLLAETHAAADDDAWEGWDRYEAVANHLYAALPVRSLCTYDRRTTSPHVLDDVTRTHPEVLTAGRSARNDRYLAPAEFLARRAQAEIDVLESTPPQLARRNPSLVEARRAVRSLARETPLDEEDVFGLVLAVNEAVANVAAHGRPPAELRAWAGDDRVVVTVRDRGVGPASPFAGLMRGAGEGRLGLWLSNQLCSRVTLTTDDQGFTVHLVGGAAQPLRPPVSDISRTRALGLDGAEQMSD